MSATVGRHEVGAGWDELVARSPHAWLWHLEAYIDAAATWPRRDDVSFAVRDASGRVEAVVPLLRVSRKVGATSIAHLESHGGAVLAPELGARARRSVMETIEDRVSQLGRDARATHVDVALAPLAPALRNGDVRVNPLLELGYENTLTQTWLVDLAPSMEEIRAAYSTRTRRELRAFETTGMNVREGTGPRAAEAYYALHVETYERTGAVPHPAAYFEAIFRDFVPRGLARVLFAEVGGRVVAAQNTALYKRGALYWTGASANERGKGVNRALFDLQIAHAQASGFEAYETGEAFPGSSDRKLAGLSEFKGGFGGQLQPFFRGRRVLRPLAQLGRDVVRTASDQLRRHRERRS
jgi:hypothetical protein